MKKGEDMKQILCFGDSNTYGLIPGTLDRYNSDVRWTGLLKKDYEKSGYTVLEEGLCGRTSVFEDPVRPGLKGIDKLPEILQRCGNIEVAVVMLGTNDCKSAYGASANVIGWGVRKIIKQIKNYDSGIKILLVSPIHLGDDVFEGYDNDFDEKSVTVSKSLGRVYFRIARQENIDFLKASDFACPSLDDREHLNEDGHRKLADAISKKLNEIINRKEEINYEKQAV